jgi:RNA polymerase sigma-54 factor
MKQALQLRLGQQLTMTPQLQQAIRLLQLSTLELRMEVQQALESNLMLETEEELDLLQESERDEDDPFEAETEAEASEELDLEADAIPEELPVDTEWDDTYANTPMLSSGAANGDDRDYETADASSDGLRDHLLWQMRMSPMGASDQAIAAAIIDAIDDDGYLQADLADIAASLDDEFEPGEIEAVLHQVQSYDPPGVAARSPAECLALQLRQMDPTTPWLNAALLMVEQHLELLGRQDLDRLGRAMGLGPEHLRQVIELIRTLNPHPGSTVPSRPVEYVIPDVVVRRVNGAWRVDLNQEVAPRLRINASYASLVRRADSSDDNQCLKNHLQEARWFLKSLQSRHETLLKVARCIVDRQRGFLEHGEEAMLPLILRDVAETVGMHESTISRVTTQKYMLTPRGVFEFKYFFSSHVSTSDGGAASATAIRALIKKLIGDENSAKPLSDSKIANLLGDQGIQVARRTVAKYRESMTIPPSNERKRLM